jgi:hypothetical protein
LRLFHNIFFYFEANSNSILKVINKIMPRKTRRANQCIILGFPKKLSSIVLPTKKDVLLYYLFVEHELQETLINKNEIGRKTTEIVSQEIKKIWEKASIPTVSSQQICSTVQKLYLQRTKLLKTGKKRRNTPGFVVKMDNFKNNCETLFEIATCRCLELQSCYCSLVYKVSIYILTIITNYLLICSNFLGA